MTDKFKFDERIRIITQVQAQAIFKEKIRCIHDAVNMFRDDGK